jgi:hypothetical protein
MYKKILLIALATLLMSFTAFAQCAAPSTEGTLKICYPSNGSSIIGGTTFEMSANTGSAAIDKVSIYDNGVKVDAFGFLPETLIEGAIHDGAHHVTVKAWDTTGRAYVAYSNFAKVGGYDPGPCWPAGSVVTVCSPKSGALEPNVFVPVSFALATPTAPKAWKIYLDGVAVMHNDQYDLKRTSTSLPTKAGGHTLSVVAWDSAGHTYKASRTFTSFYQYDCNPNTGVCTPGIVADAPQGFGPYEAVDTPQSFPFHAEVTKNPKPIQKMSVTLDGVVIVSGQGPGVSTTVNATHGSHVIAVQAMDTAGKLYSTYGTVDVH